MKVFRFFISSFFSKGSFFPMRKKPNDVNSFQEEFLKEYELMKEKKQFYFKYKRYTVNLIAFDCNGSAQ